MKTLCLFMVPCLVLGMAFSSAAQGGDVEGPYEAQLQNYSRFHDELMQEKVEMNEGQRLKNEELKIAEFQLKEEYDNLQTGIEVKEEGIERLKELNAKFKKDFEESQGQYLKLEALFQKKKAENDLLKEEIEANKSVFYQKMIEFYTEEDQMLDEVLEEEGEMLNEKITVLQERQKEVQLRIQKMKEFSEDVSDEGILDIK